MKALVLVTSAASALELVSGAKSFCGETVLIALGDESLARCADKSYVLKYEGSRIHCAAAVLSLVEQEDPDLVLVEQNIDGRYFAALIAAKLGTSVMTDSKSLSHSDAGFCSQRMAYGGCAYKTEQASGKAVACVGSGVFERLEDAPSACVETIEVQAAPGITTLSVREKAVQSVNIAAAKKVIGVGRGIGSEENVRLAQQLASAIGAELACTRPISEEEGWMGKERYVGVSGVIIKPNIYLSLGISGQIQHTVGVNNSGTIISINKDKNAPMFKQSDYGYVGDIAQILPKLIEMLK